MVFLINVLCLVIFNGISAENLTHFNTIFGDTVKTQFVVIFIIIHKPFYKFQTANQLKYFF